MRRYLLSSLLLVSILFPAFTQAQDSLGVTELGSLRFDWARAYDIATEGNYAYIADGNAGLRIVDISNWMNPVEVGSFRTPGEATMVAVHGQTAFLGGDAITDYLPNERGYYERRSAVYILDVSDRTNPRQVARWDSVTALKGIGVIEEYLLVAYENQPTNLDIIDISDPTHPRLFTTQATANYVQRMLVKGTDVFLTHRVGFTIYSLANPVEPREVGFANANAYLYEIAVDGNLICASEGYSFHCFTRNGREIEDRGEIAFKSPRGQSWSVNSITLRDGYATVGLRFNEDNIPLTTLRVLDVANLDAITTVAELPTATLYGRGIRFDGYGLFAAGAGGLGVVNLADPNEPSIIENRLSSNPVTRSVIDGDLAFLANGDGGWSIVDVTDPRQPQLQYVDRSRFVGGLAMAGGDLYTLGRWLCSFDLTDPRRPVRMADWYRGDGSRYYDLVSGGYLFAGGESYTSIFDTSVPERPASIGSISISAVDAQDGDLVIGHSGGMSVWDISIPARPFRTASYTTEWPVFDIATKDSLAFAACGHNRASDGALHVLSYQNIYQIEEVSFLQLPGSGRSIALSDSFAFVAADYAGLRIIDVRDPSLPIETGHYDTPFRASSVQARGTTAYVSDSLAFRIFDCSEAMGRARRLIRTTGPTEFLSAYPNPCNSSATVTFTLNNSGRIVLKAYDAQGRVAFDLSPQGASDPGVHTIRWDAGALPSGRYILSLEADGKSSSRPISIVR